MGHSNWSDAAYEARQSHRHKTKQSAFTYDNVVRSTGIRKVHDDMNPKRVTRESRDSDAHPDSVAIAVIFDVTGSMGNVPRVLQTKLGKLMRLLVQKGYVEHPQMLFGAVGDAYSDAVPLQIGQFESGLEMDDDLGKIFIEGGGGGQVHESYELAIYFMARHTKIDCYEKRGKKGYLFTIGDEKPYAAVSRRQIHQHIGDNLLRDVPIKKIVQEGQTRYEHFHIIPTQTSHGRNPEIQACWQELLGERVLLLEDEAAVCETIALAIGLCEGTIYDLDQGADDLVNAGCDATATTVATTALAAYAKTSNAIVPVAAGLLPASNGRAVKDGRL